MLTEICLCNVEWHTRAGELPALDAEDVFDEQQQEDTAAATAEAISPLDKYGQVNPFGCSVSLLIVVVVLRRPPPAAI